MTGQWEQLDRRTVAVTALLMAGVSVTAGLPTGFGIARGTSVTTALAWVLAGAAVLVAGGAVVDLLRWRSTRYRIGPDRVELHSGIVIRKRRSLQRDRIRTVDLTADPLLRVFGLVTVRIGTGDQTSSGEGTVALRPVRRDVGEELRRILLHRPPADEHREEGCSSSSTRRGSATPRCPSSPRSSAAARSGSC
jgi:putative membrane protein